MGARQLLCQKPVGKIRHSIASTNITTAAYVELEDELPASCVAVGIGYTGDAILILAKGASGEEVDLPFYVMPGQSGEVIIPLELAKNIRLSAKALDQNMTIGEIVINLYG